MNSRTELPSYRILLGEAERALLAAGIPNARLDAEVLLAASMRRDRSFLYASLGEPVSDEVSTRFRSMVGRRQQRQPVAYITETKEFWSLPFLVTPAVLVPRPETEILVQASCELLAGCRDPLVCDLGTGSGCIAVALASEHPTARVVATDISLDALRIARYNTARHWLENRIGLLCADLLEGVLPEVAFDLIVSNPPYVPAESELATELFHEPATALFAGESGLDTIERLLSATPSRLRDDGHLVMEIGAGQESAVRRMVAASDFASADFRCDLAGIPRVLIARRSAATHG